ncbi:hypothetical protein NKH72_21705 [Mesorhizobium sp. M0955]|uniref:hypothetical protein n=1 Tax=Mesorhizobium sp. M0955 TaxID=2957033 RepID=UPI00333AD40D
MSNDMIHIRRSGLEKMISEHQAKWEHVPMFYNLGHWIRAEIEKIEITETPAAPTAIAAQAFTLAADLVGGMKRAAAHANVAGHHAEAYGAVETYLRGLGKQAENGEEIRDNNGLVRHLGVRSAS